MAIQYNDITAIGDVFEVRANTPIIGIQGVSGYTDDVLNETATRYFDKEFRFSRDGITYTTWKTLTNTNLQNEFVDETDIFDIQYRYTRAGTDDTGYLTFNSITLIGAIQVQSNPKVFTDLYFNKFFNYNDSEVLRWALNVLDKLYRRGVIANYVERGEITSENDEDYLAFFGALTHFFAIIVRYAREFRDFTLNDVLLLEYLKQKNVFLCDDLDLTKLQHILSNLYINFLQRGTNEIIKKAGEDGRIVDGELLRLICKDDLDEFLFGLMEKEKTIWNVNNNSPLYKGTKGAVNLIKAYEYTQSVTDLTKYPLLNDSFITKYTDSGNDVIRILNATGTTISGIGDAKTKSKLILIDSRVGYEITFQVKQAVLGDYLYLAVNLYDKDEVLLTDTPLSAISGTQTNIAINKESLNLNDEYYFIRVILFNGAEEFNAKHVLDVGFGNHLILNNSDAKFMSVVLGSNITSGGTYDGNNDLRIWDFKVRPLIENFANGFVMIPNIITSFLENNSEETNIVVENKIKRFLVPYDTILKNQFLDDLYVESGTPLQITVTKTDETSINASNGTITISALGGTEPYLYSIDNGVTFYSTNEFSNLAAGTYDIVVEDAEGIQVTESVTILAGATDLAIEAFATACTTLISNDGEIEIIGSGGVTPYYYSIDGTNYQASNKFTGLAVGNYTAYLKDSANEEVTVGVSITAVRDNLLTITVRDENSVLVEGVDVEVTNLSPVENYITDVNGEVSIYLDDGYYDFEFTKSGYFTGTLTNEAVINDKNVSFTLVNQYSLTFLGKTVTNTNITNAIAEMTSAPSLQSLVTLDHNVAESPVRPGSYTLLASVPVVGGVTYESKSVSFTLANDRIEEIVLRRIFELRGEVRDLVTNNLLSGVSVRISYSATLNPLEYNLSTNSSGAFGPVDVLQNNTAYIRLSKTNYQTKTVNYSITADLDLDLTLEPVEFDVVITKEGVGTTSPSGTEQVYYGQDLTVNFNPGTGYVVRDVFLNGVDLAIPGASSYTITNITSNQTLHVIFDDQF